MPSVDDRVVRIEFDNAAFERNVATTLNSLDKLNKALKFDGATKGLNDVSDAAGRFHMGSIGDAVEGIGAKFLALSTIGITALSNLTTAAMHAGVQIAKGLLDPIKDGFAEYETNLNSIQTILANTASKGTTMDQVTASLDKLNEYSDKTIYNFGQMARNIGTFTAAGVDLDTSVNAIKGIANLAAMSGSSSEQASSAMYQLSQAMASGTLKAQDWISVVNSGMGGEALQSALYETAKAMGTLTNVPMDQTFTDWKDAGGNFKDAMAEGVFTSEVLSTTLEGFTGDLSDAQLAAKGFTDAQIASIQATAKTAQSAATEVKTFTQLMGTVKEAVGTGWADSMKIIIGDFGEAKHTWTALNKGIGDFVKRNADARNELLQGWKDLGGRAQLIEGFHSAISNIATILRTVSKAFHDIFPPTTAQQLMNMTNSFVAFTKALQPSQQTIENITRIAHGFFSILEIGWTIIKSGIGFIKDLVTGLSGLGGGGFLEFAAKIGDFFTTLNEKLVSGGAIKDFFANLTTGAQTAITWIAALKDKIVEFFSGLMGGGGQAGDAMGALNDRLSGLATLGDKLKDVWHGFIEGSKKVKDVVSDVWDALKEFFSTIGSKIGDILASENWDAGLDGIKVGLLGGIAAMFAKFLKDGFKIDFGQLGLIDSIRKTFGELDGVLQAFQQNIKADTLMKIAEAIAILTASVVILSLIDAEALAKALGAMAIGFTQLMGAFKVLDQMDSSFKGVVNLTLMSGAMTTMATSILILSAAAKVMGDMSWDEIARGLSGVTALMAIMIGAVLLMEGHETSMVGTAIGLIGLAVALRILAGAVKIFAEMSWEQLATGFGATTVGLITIAAAMRAMPKGLLGQGAGLLLVAISLEQLSKVIMTYAAIDFVDLAKGLLGIFAALGLIGIALRLMPDNMITTGVGLAIVSASLLLIASALEKVAALSWEELAKGLLGIAAALIVLAVATNAMTGAILGAVAIGITAAALLLLVEVVKQFADLSWGDLLKGLVGIAVVLGVLAAAALLLQPAIPALFALGGALAVIGVGFALFGAGVYLVAKAFEILSSVSSEGSDNFIRSIEAMGKAIPAFAKGAAEGVVEFIKTLGTFTPIIVDTLVMMIEKLLEGLAKLVPAVVNLIIKLLTGLIDIIKTWYPMLINAGIEIILSLLRGIAGAVPQIVEIAGKFIADFINALAGQLGPIIDAGVNLILAFLQGITSAVPRIIDGVVTLVLTIIQTLSAEQNRIITAGTDLLIAFLSGISDNLNKVIDAAFDIITKFIEGISNNIFRLATAATDVVVKFAEEIGNNAQKVIDAGGDLIIKLIEGFGKKSSEVIDAGVTAVEKFLEGLGNNIVRIANAAGDFIVDLVNGLANAIDTHNSELRDAGMNLAAAVLDGMTFGLSSKAKGVADEAAGVAKSAFDAAKGVLGIHSPSTAFYYIGEMSGQGLIDGMESQTPAIERTATTLADRTVEAFSTALSGVSNMLDTSPEFNPTITPILDLTRVINSAGQIADYINTSATLSPGYSYAQARNIATTANAQQDDAIKAPAGAGEVVFNQTINAPTQLSTSEIYRQTRNQITMAKQELSIP